MISHSTWAHNLFSYRGEVERSTNHLIVFGKDTTSCYEFWGRKDQGLEMVDTHWFESSKHSKLKPMSSEIVCFENEELFSFSRGKWILKQRLRWL